MKSLGVATVADCSQTDGEGKQQPPSWIIRCRHLGSYSAAILDHPVTHKPNVAVPPEASGALLSRKAEAFNDGQR